jgi:signal transduction histidine kinase
MSRSSGAPEVRPEVAYATLAELARLGASGQPPSLLAERALVLVLKAVGAASGEVVIDSSRGPQVLAGHWEHPRDTLPRRLTASLRAAGNVVGRIECAAATPFGEGVQELLDAVGALLGPLVGGGSVELAQNVLELRTLQRVADTVSRSLDLEEVLGRCLDMALQVAHAPAGAIYLRDGQRGVYRRVQQRNMPEDVGPSEFPVAMLDPGIVGHAARILGAGELGRTSVTGAAAERHGFRQVMLLPLRIEGRAVGLLALDFYAENSFAPSTVLTLEAIAGQEAVAIENARVHFQAELRARLALTLREFGEKALTCNDEKEVYPLVLETALKLARGDRGLVSRVSEDGKTFRVVAGTGQDAALVGMSASLETISGEQPGLEPLVVEDTSKLDPNTLFGRVSRQNGTASFVLVLMRYKGTPLGHVFSASGEPRRYEPAEVEALQLLSAMAAEVIQRAVKQAEAEQQRRRLDAIIEHLPIVIAVLDRQGRVVHQNRYGREFGRYFSDTADNWRNAVQTMQLYTAEGKPIPPDQVQVVRAFRGEECKPEEMIVASPDGKRKMHVMAVAAPLYGLTGEVQEVVTAFQDVSALRELADAKDRFLRVASHELRSPITSLRATTSLLEMDPAAIADPERRATMLQRIQRQVDRLIKLVEQLLDSARLNASEVPIQLAPCDLVPIVREAIELAASTQSKPDEAARVKLEAPASYPGQWDPLRIEQVLTNLIGNALRYSPGDRRVIVRIRDGAPDRVVMEVVDEGIGIPPDQLTQVFSPFFRGANAQAQHKGGLGLGLHITAEIVRRHGGDIRVSSELGRGSAFTVELPRHGS